MGNFFQIMLNYFKFKMQDIMHLKMSLFCDILLLFIMWHSPDTDWIHLKQNTWYLSTVSVITHTHNHPYPNLNLIPVQLNSELAKKAENLTFNRAGEP